MAKIQEKLCNIYKLATQIFQRKTHLLQRNLLTFSQITAYFFFPIYLTGSTALTVSGEHGWHTLEGWWLFVILGICFGHAVTDAFRVCCCLNFDSFASLRWTVTVAIPVALGFEIQKQQPAQNRNQSIGCLTLKNLRKFLKQLMAKRDNAPIK